jgi:hypothetical protein
MAAAKKPLRALTTFAADNRIIREGDVVAPGDAVVKGRAELFEPHDPSRVTAEPPIEAATSAPGEKRP